MNLDDRRVHAKSAHCELVRYNRAGKWYVEDEVLGRSHVTLEQAARLARHWRAKGGRVFLGVSGGTAFDRLVNRATTGTTTRDLFQDALDDWLKVALELADIRGVGPEEEKAIYEKYRARLREYHQQSKERES